MINAARPDSKVESYLAKVRTALGELPSAEVDDILRELRSHADELSEQLGVDAALGSLGDPVDLARTYRDEKAMARAECSSSPLVILGGLRSSARSGAGRVLVTALYFFGYANFITMWAAALDKLVAPSKTGLYYTPGDWWLLTWVTDGRAPSGGRELLGWWLVPLAVAGGWAVKYAVDLIAQWWIRRVRRKGISGV